MACLNWFVPTIVFVASIIVFIIMLPLFNKVIGLLPFGANTVMFCSVLVLMLIVAIVYKYVQQNMFDLNGGEVQ